MRSGRRSCTRDHASLWDQGPSQYRRPWRPGAMVQGMGGASSSSREARLVQRVTGSVCYVLPSYAASCQPCSHPRRACPSHTEPCKRASAQASKRPCHAICPHESVSNSSQRCTCAPKAKAIPTSEASQRAKPACHPGQVPDSPTIGSKPPSPPVGQPAASAPHRVHCTALHHTAPPGTTARCLVHTCIR